MEANLQPKLTPREIQIVQLIWKELSAKEIAKQLAISKTTRY
jgi:DNA-binding NarL/FixJ family response regulator